MVDRPAMWNLGIMIFWFKLNQFWFLFLFYNFVIASKFYLHILGFVEMLQKGGFPAANVAFHTHSELLFVFARERDSIVWVASWKKEHLSWFILALITSQS